MCAKWFQRMCEQFPPIGSLILRTFMFRSFLTPTHPSRCVQNDLRRCANIPPIGNLVLRTVFFECFLTLGRAGGQRFGSVRDHPVYTIIWLTRLFDSHDYLVDTIIWLTRLLCCTRLFDWNTIIWLHDYLFTRLLHWHDYLIEHDLKYDYLFETRLCDWGFWCKSM